MRGKKWILFFGVGMFFLGLLGSVVTGRIWLKAKDSRDISDGLSNSVEDSGSSLKEKNLELLGQITLLKKMLGEIDGEVVLLGPSGSFPIGRGRLVWDQARMEGFIHAVKINSQAGTWFVNGYHNEKRMAHCPVAGPDQKGTIQEVFRPGSRLLIWDEFRLVRMDDYGVEETVLVGKRSL